MDSYFYVGQEPILHILKEKNISLDLMEKSLFYAQMTSFFIGIEMHVISLPMIFLFL